MLDHMDGFDHYGNGTTGAQNMVDFGVVLEALAGTGTGGNGGLFISESNPSTGARHLRRNTGDNGSTTTGQNLLRRAFSGPKDNAGIKFGLYISALPTVSSRIGVISFRDGANADQIILTMDTTGILEVRGSSLPSGTLLGASDGPVIVAGSYQVIQMFATCHATTGTVEVRVNGVTVINVSGVNTNPRGTDVFSQWAMGRVSAAGDNRVFDYDDLWVWDSSGTSNNDFPGNVRVRMGLPDQDTAQADWTRNTGSTDFSAIDETTPDGDTTYIQADTVNDISEFDFEDTPAEVSAILAAQTYVLMKKTDAGDSSVQVSLVSAANEANGTDREITTAYTYWMDRFEVDPDTGAAWTKSAIDAALLKLERTV